MRLSSDFSFRILNERSLQTHTRFYISVALSLSKKKVNEYIKHILNWVETMIIIIVITIFIIIAIYLNILEFGIKWVKLLLFHPTNILCFSMYNFQEQWFRHRQCLLRTQFGFSRSKFFNRIFFPTNEIYMSFA